MKRSFADNTNNTDTCSISIIDLQKKALDIIRKSKPLIISVDLDFTLWPSLCFEETCAPYVTDLSIENPTKLACCDPRSNNLRIFSLFNEVRDVLKWCLDNDIMLTICSRCPSMSAAKSILISLGMWDWFVFPQIFRGRKSYHFRNLTECLGLSYNDFLFFDDDLGNIKSCKSMGVTTCHVDREHGLNWKTFVDGLILHSNEINNHSLCQNNLHKSIIKSSSSYFTSLPSLSTCSPTTTSSESSSSDEDELINSNDNGGKFLQIRAVKAKIYEFDHSAKFRIIDQIQVDNMNNNNNDYMTSVYF